MQAKKNKLKKVIKGSSKTQKQVFKRNKKW